MLSEAERMMMARALLAPPPQPPAPPPDINEAVSGWAANNLPMWAQPGQLRNQQVLPDRWGDILPYPVKRLRGK